jgi:2-amino-4-hydroxy-6-hydroxymethyldihydropteridine diphosphokinase
MPATVVIALGSNLGDRRLHLLRAIELLKRVVSIVRISAIVETEPVDAPPPKYLNMVVVGHTSLPPESLLETMLAIEARLGRRRPARRNAPRTIDLDLIAYGARRMRSATLTLPHPRAAQRSFVVEPLREVWIASSALIT